MSYTFSNEIQYADTQNLDAFGRLRTSGITSLLEIKHVYDKQPLLEDEVVSGTGSSSTWGNSQVTLVAGTGGYVIRQSKNSAVYQPGKSQIIEASFSNFGIESGVTKRVGYFTGATGAPYNSSFDGFFLESGGTAGVISFQIWRNGTNVVNSPLSSWSTDDYDATLINWDLTQLMMCDFQWLGVGRLRFSMVVDGTPRTFIENSGTNNLSLVYMLQPNKPLRCEIRSSTSPGTFVQICSQVSMEGSINSLYKVAGFGNFTERTLASTGTVYPILGYRINPSYRGIDSVLKNVSILQTSNDNYVVTLRMNPTLSTVSSWSDITNTPIQYSQGDGTTVVSSPGFILTNFMGTAGSLGTNDIEFEDSAISPGIGINGTPDELWVCIEPFGANATFRATANVNYFD